MATTLAKELYVVMQQMCLNRIGFFYLFFLVIQKRNNCSQRITKKHCKYTVTQQSIIVHIMQRCPSPDNGFRAKQIHFFLSLAITKLTVTRFTFFIILAGTRSPILHFGSTCTGTAPGLVGLALVWACAAQADVRAHITDTFPICACQCVTTTIRRSANEFGVTIFAQSTRFVTCATGTAQIRFRTACSPWQARCA